MKSALIYLFFIGISFELYTECYCRPGGDGSEAKPEDSQGKQAGLVSTRLKRLSASCYGTGGGMGGGTGATGGGGGGGTGTSERLKAKKY